MKIGKRSSRLLRAHVGDGIGAQADVGLCLCISGSRFTRQLKSPRLRQPEVHDFYAPGSRQHDVLRFQIAVHDAGVMGRGQAIGNLRGEVQDATDRKWGLADLWRSVCPSINSETMWGVSPSNAASNTVTMFG